MVRTDRELWELRACATVLLRARALAAGHSASTQRIEAKDASEPERDAATRVDPSTDAEPSSDTSAANE